MKLITYLAGASFFLMVGACSPQARINRIISNHPEIQINDSIRIKTKLKVPARSAAMSMPMERIINLKTGDTISATHNNITLVIGRENDSASFDIKVPAIIVEKDTMVRINKIEAVRSVKRKKWKRIDWIIFTVLFASALNLFASLIRRRRPNQ